MAFSLPWSIDASEAVRRLLVDMLAFEPADRPSAAGVLEGPWLAEGSPVAKPTAVRSAADGGEQSATKTARGPSSPAVTPCPSPVLPEPLISDDPPPVIFSAAPPSSPPPPPSPQRGSADSGLAKQLLGSLNLWSGAESDAS